jgi:LuxR family maltose regulon positive regulatory protein
LSLEESSVLAQARSESYFQRWVFDAISNELGQFLIESSSFEMLHGPFCDYALGRQDSQMFIEELLEHNLLIRGHPSPAGWYRLQPQFRAFLQSRALSLYTDYTNEISFRAYEWFERNGEKTQAARHLLMAVDTMMLKNFTAPAIRCLDTEGQSEGQASPYADGRASPYADGQASPYADGQNLKQWVLSHSVAELADNPAFALLSSVAYLIIGDSLASLRWLDIFAASMADASAARVGIDPQGAQFVVDCIKIKITSLSGRHSEAISAVQKLLAVRGENMPAALECMCACTLGESYERTGQFALAQENYLRSEAIGKVANSVFGQFISSHQYASMQVLFGRFNLALELCYQALRNCPQDLPTYGGFYRLIADIQIEKGELPEARVSLHRAFRRLSPIRSIDMYLEACIVRAKLHTAEGDLEGAYELLRQNSRLTTSIAVARGIGLMSDLALAKLALARKSFYEAGLLLEKVKAQSSPADVAVDLEVRLLDARLLIGESCSYEAALTLLGDVVSQSKQHNLSAINAEALLASVLPYLRSNKKARAILNLSDALAYGKQTGVLNLFVVYREQIRALLQEMAQSNKTAPNIAGFSRKLLLVFDARDALDRRHLSKEMESENPVLSVLTAREREIIRLVANGLSRKEISDVLCITLNTVKTHMSAIFTKLGVSSRAEVLELLN